MKFMISFRWIALTFLVVSLSSGCALFSGKNDTMAKIEKTAALGISEKEFNTALPEARLVDAGGNKKVYLAVVKEPCLICSDKWAFLRSSELYPIRFTFNNGVLVSMDRVAR